MESEARSYQPFTPTMSVIPNNAHQTNTASTQTSTHRMAVEVEKQGNKGSTPNSVVSVSTSTATTSSAYAIADIQMVDVQYGAVDPTQNKVTVSPPWPATSTLPTKVTTQVPTFSGYPSNKTHTVVVDVSKENDLGIPALVATTNFGQTPVGEAGGTKTPTFSYIDDSLTGVMNLKKLFKTLQEFANKRSRTAGEKVTQLINNLVAGRVSVEKFHEEVGAATDYPIKDCLIPIIKDNLPTLQREFSQAQKIAASPVTSSPSNPMIGPAPLPGQSKSQPVMQAPPPPYTQSEQILQQNSNTFLKRKRPRNLQNLNSLGEIISPDVTVVSWQDATKKPKPSVSTSDTPMMSLPSATAMIASSSSSAQEDKQSAAYPEEWRHVDQMMWCIIGMVEKTRQAINTLRSKHYTELESWKSAMKNGDMPGVPSTSTTTSNVTSAADTNKAVEIAIAAVKHQAEIDRQRIMAQADQKCKEEIQKAKKEMAERLLKAQQASHDVPLQETSDVTCLSGSGGEVASGGSVVGSSRDLERHVSVEEAEQHWRGELEQMRRELDTLKESLKDQDQVDSEESCWNCGRVARDKCSGCGKAIYCGRFCQLKHWSRHQLKCLQLRGNKVASSNSYPALGHQNSTRATLQTVATTTAASHTAMVNANNDVIIIPSLQPTTNKSIIPGAGHILVTSHPPVRYHQEVNHSPNMIVNNSPHQQPTQIQSPVATVISLDSSKSKAKPVTQDVVTISSPTQPPRLSNADPVASSS